MRLIVLIMFFCVGCVSGEVGQADTAAGPGSGERVCAADEKRCLGERKSQRCANDGTWSVPRNCEQGSCVEGQCMTSCEGSCVEGTRRCSPEGIQSCRKAQDGCGVWAVPQACPEGSVCEGESCRPTACQDNCRPGDRRCAGEREFTICESDRCASWSAERPCPEGQSCSGGRCIADDECTDQCQQGMTTCLDRDRVQRCQRQRNGCLDFSSGEMCPNETRCIAGQGCAAACVDEQCQMGQTRCLQGGVQSCVLNVDGCQVWGAIRSCERGTECVDGACVDTCMSECVVGDFRCGQAGIQACGDDGTGCGRWGPEVLCPQGTSCRDDGICGVCLHGESETRECRRCGFELRSCINGTWTEWGSCEFSLECEPGDTSSCQNCGQRRCGNDCQWDECENTGECVRGEVRDCGQCGLKTCGADCQWGECGNGDGTAFQRCNHCGWQFCCSGGDWCPCDGHFDQECNVEGICDPDGFCVE